MESFDPAILLDRLEGDRELFIQIMGVFFDDVPKLLDALTDAVDSGDLQGVMLHAHTLKGSASHVGATAMQDVAKKIEEMGKEGDLGSVRLLCSELEKEFEKLRGSLGGVA